MKQKCTISSPTKYQDDIQGDHSRCSQPPDDIKTEVEFQYKEHIGMCFGVNGGVGNNMNGHPVDQRTKRYGQENH